MVLNLFHVKPLRKKYMGTPKPSILIGFSIINHPFWDTPIFGNMRPEFLRFPSELPGRDRRSLAENWWRPSNRGFRTRVCEWWAPLKKTKVIHLIQWKRLLIDFSIQYII